MCAVFTLVVTLTTLQVSHTDAKPALIKHLKKLISKTGREASYQSQHRSPSSIIKKEQQEPYYVQFNQPQPQPQPIYSTNSPGVGLNSLQVLAKGIIDVLGGLQLNLANRRRNQRPQGIPVKENPSYQPTQGSSYSSYDYEVADGLKVPGNRPVKVNYSPPSPINYNSQQNYNKEVTLYPYIGPKDTIPQPNSDVGYPQFEHLTDSERYVLDNTISSNLERKNYNEEIIFPYIAPTQEYSNNNRFEENGQTFSKNLESYARNSNQEMNGFLDSSVSKSPNNVLIDPLSGLPIPNNSYSDFEDSVRRAMNGRRGPRRNNIRRPDNIVISPPNYSLPEDFEALQNFHSY